MRHNPCSTPRRVFVARIYVTPLVAMLTLLVGCAYKRGPATPAASTQPRGPELEVPLTDATMSAFVPENGKCAWRRFDPVAGRSAVVATFEGDCFGATVCFSMDGKKAAVRFDPFVCHNRSVNWPGKPKAAWPSEEWRTGMPSRSYEVVLETGAVRDLTPPDSSSVAYGPNGLLAFTTQTLTDAERRAGHVTVDDTAIEVPETHNGIPAMAHAWQETEGVWRRIETQPTTTDWDYAEDVGALDAHARLGPCSVGRLSGRVLTDAAPEVYSVTLEQERPPGTHEYDGWAMLRGAAAPVFLFQVRGEFPHSTSLIRFVNGESLEAPERFEGAGGEIVSLTWQGPYLLVAGVSSGTHPRFYNLTTRRLVWASDTARAVIFWPRPTPPSP
jgi:hypothetical protein